MEFKHQKDYDELSEPCPPLDYQPKNLEKVYRWVFDDMNDERNFMSQYHRNPKRFLKSPAKTKCVAMALSMFTTLEGSKARFEELKEEIGEKVYLNLGTGVAVGKLSVEDGVNGSEERLGHFTHHASVAANYHAIFHFLQKI